MELGQLVKMSSETGLMNIDKLIGINRKINVVKIGARKGTYISTIQGKNSREFQIDLPLKKTQGLNLHVGDQVKISLVVENNKYEFKTVVTGKYIDNIPLYTLLVPKEFTRVQNRKFVRLPVMLDILYAEKTGGKKKSEYIKGHTLDISGGGLRFASNKSYPINTVFEFKIMVPELPDALEIKVLGKVVRIADVTDAGYHISVKYTDISVSDQEKLIKYILKETSRSKRLI